jgi:hypothetical protein
VWWLLNTSTSCPNASKQPVPVKFNPLYDFYLLIRLCMIFYLVMINDGQLQVMYLTHNVRLERKHLIVIELMRFFLEIKKKIPLNLKLIFSLSPCHILVSYN